MGAGVTGAHLLLSAGTASAEQPGGHEHVLQVPVTLGPLILRVGLLLAVPAVAAFAVLRGFLGRPSRTTAASVTVVAALAVLLELMLADGLDLPPPAVVFLLAALAAPIFLVLSEDPRFTVTRAVLRRLAPWLVSAAAVAAFVEFARALTGAGDRGSALHTGVVLALAGLSWFAGCGPGHRVTTILVRIEAALLGNAALAAAAYAVVLTLPGLTTQSASGG